VDLHDLGNVGEFVGGVGFVVSIVYLALQIRQNTLAVRMTAHHHVFESYREILAPIKTNERLAELLRSTDRFTTLSPREQIPIATFFVEWLLHFQTCHVLYRAGALEEETFRAYENTALSLLQMPGYAHMWQHLRRAIHTSTTELIDARLRQPSSLPPRFEELMPWWRADGVGSGESKMAR
jgi:hypothetical protein